MKKLLSMILIAVLALSLLPAAALAAEPPVEVTPDYAWYGDGEAAVYTLTDVEDLFGFADIVNGKAIIGEAAVKDSFDGKTVRLNADIDLTGMVWTPIGSSMYSHAASADATKKFKGSFDGQNHTITGLSSTGYVPLSEDATVEYSFGLFGYAYGANIKNVKLAAVNINCCTVEVAEGTKSVDGSGVAALVGFYVPKNGAVSVIENCHVLSGTVTATNNMGGLIGVLETQDNNIAVKVTIKDCSNAAAVTTLAREAGGILGLAHDFRYDTGSLEFVNCSNSGAVTALAGAENSVASGILGKEHSAEVYGDFQVIFNGCSNSGTITAIGQSGAEVHASGMGTSYYAHGVWLVATDCSNTGDIIITGGGTDNFAGGIFALALHATLDNCASAGTVTVLGTDKGTPHIGAHWSSGGMLCLNGSATVTNEMGAVFLLNGGDAQAAIEFEEHGGNNTYHPSAPIRENFTFGGWYRTDGYIYQVPNYEGEAAEHFPVGHTYHAKWIPVAPKLMVSDAGETEITLAATHPVEGVTYTWYKGGELIENATGSTLSVSADESASYTAKASKDNIMSGVSNAIAITAEVSEELASMDVTVKPYSGTYDGEKHNITVICEGETVKYYTDSLCTVETDGFTDAGEYTVYYKISKTINESVYDLTGSSTITIEKATVTVTADNKTATVGSAQPELTYIAVGFVGADTFIAEPTCIAVDVDMESAGSYAITVSGGTVGSNYEVEYVSGTLTVTNPPVPMPVYTARVPAGVNISPANPWPGATVNVTVKDENMDGVRVVDAKGNPVRVSLKDGAFSFVMPYGDVDIVPFEVPFTDVAETDYFAEAMLWALANDITEGTSETTFSPAAPCTRAEMVTFLWRAAGCPAPAAAESAFTDIDPEAYYAKALLWAAEQGITAGSGDGVFSPNAACDRAQMAVFLQRMAKGKAVSAENSFADVAADAYYANAVQWALEQGITAGTGEGTYSPDAVCTRAQMVTFLWRGFGD